MSATLASVCLALVQVTVPQAAPPPEPVGSSFGVFSGVLGPHGFDFTRLGLGDGGLGTRRGDLRDDRDGTYVTSSGVSIVVQAQGVKFDFPSGADLIVSSAGALNLRSGESTPPHLNGLLIALADGVVIEIVPQGGRDRPLRHVEVREGGRTRIIWRSGAVLTWSPASRASRQVALFALGDGRAIYRAGILGPIVAFERVLCPKSVAGELPTDCIAILGDVLGMSLADLAMIARQRAAADPSLQQQAAGLARIAPHLFSGEPRMRPEGARGDLFIALDDVFRIQVELRDRGMVAIDLWMVDRDAPECEWISSSTTYLHMFRRADDGRLRYAMQGVDLRRQLDGLLPIGRPTGGDALVRRLLAKALGTDRKVPIGRREL